MPIRLSDSTSPPCFSRRFLHYRELQIQYDTLCRYYPGWSLDEVRLLTQRERDNWIRIIRWREKQ